MIIDLPKVIGHRGVKDLAPENTIVSLYEATKYNIKWIEVDVKISKDHIPFLLHDDLLDRTTSGKGYPYNYLFNEIIKFDAGSWFDKKFVFTYPPSLEEVLNFCVNKNIGLNVEIKSNKGKEKENVNAIIALFSKNNPDFQYFFSSFDYFSLELMREKKPTTLLSYLINNIENNIHLNNIIYKCLNIKCFSIGVDSYLINERLIRKFKDNNLKITVFSNKSIDYKTAVDLWNKGVDSIFVDNPIYFKKVLNYNI